MLTPEKIESIFLDHGWHWSGKADAYIPVACAIEAEVRKDNAALIRQLVEAMERSTDPDYAAIDAGRARLENT